MTISSKYYIYLQGKKDSEHSLMIILVFQQYEDRSYQT